MKGKSFKGFLKPNKTKIILLLPAIIWTLLVFYKFEEMITSTEWWFYPILTYPTHIYLLGVVGVLLDLGLLGFFVLFAGFFIYGIFGLCAFVAAILTSLLSIFIGNVMLTLLVLPISYLIYAYLVSCWLERLFSSKVESNINLYYVASTIITAMVMFWAFIPYIPPTHPSLQGIEVTETYCTDGSVYLKIKNIGSADIPMRPEWDFDKIEVKRVSPAPDVDTPSICCDNVIATGESDWYIDPTCGSGNTCTYKMTPPIGKSIVITQNCA